MSKSSEVRVGLFVLAAIVLGLFAATVLKGGIASRTGGYYFEIWFSEAPGVGKGSPVRLAGVEVGEVVEKDVIQVTEVGQLRVTEATDRNLLPYEMYTSWRAGTDAKDQATVDVDVKRLAPVQLGSVEDYQRTRNVARLKVRVRSEYDLYTRFNYEITGGLVFGERQLNINDSGPDNLPIPTHQRGESIPALIADGRRVAVLGEPPADLDAIVGTAQKVVDDETATRLKGIIANIDRLTEESSEMLAALRATVQANQGNASAMMQNLTNASASLTDTLNASRGRLASILASTDQAAGVMGRLAVANEARGSRIMSNVENVTANVATLTRDSEGHIQNAIGELSATAKEARGLIADTRGGIGETMNRMADTSRNVQATSAEARESVATMLANMEDTTARLRDAVRDSDVHLRAVAENSAALTASAREAVDGLRGEVPKIAANLRVTTENAAEASARVRDLAGDPALRATLVNTEEASAEAKALLADVRRITSDPKLQSDLKDTVASAKQAAESVAALTGGGTGAYKPKLGLDAYWSTPGNDWNANARLAFGMGQPKRFSYHLFLDHLATRIQLGGQIGRTVFSPSLTARAGLYRGRLAVGADYGLGTYGAARADLYDPANPKLNLRYTHLLPFGFSGFVGVEDVWDEPTWLLGIQLGTPFGANKR